MGSSDTSTTQSQQSTSAPGAMTAPTVQSILNQLNPLIANSGVTSPQQTAINQLTANGQAGNPYAAAEGANASNLLAGGGATSQNGALTDNLNTLRTTLGQYTDPNYSTVNSPEVQRALQVANAGITNQVNGQFAASGRTGSGYNTQTLAQGIENADAPIILNQANTDNSNRMAAANALYGAGNTTSGAISGNLQTSLGNQIAGNGAATSALNASNWGPQSVIAAQELGKSIPATDLGLLAQIGIPLAGLNQTTSGNLTQNTQSSPSLLQQITGIGGLFAGGANGASSAAANMGSAAAGAGSGILGLLGML
jgi:hypothetical protein